MKKKSFILLLFLFLSQFVNAQIEGLGNLRSKILLIEKEDTLREEYSIDPNSIIIKKNAADLNVYDYDIDNNVIIISTSAANKSLPIEIHYRVFPFNLEKQFSILDSANVSFEDRVIRINSKDYLSQSNPNQLIQSQNLNYSGSFSRGLSFGNSQDLVLNSNLNLQLNGDLGDGLLIKAAISDEDIPIQPQGNTQILQDFDRVYVEIKKNKTKVVAGDYELASPKNYFVRYFKKLKGLSVENESSVFSGFDIKTKASYAISRGKFARINLPTNEGNQGPYQLRTETNNRFIIVLSGTEKVYLDGKLLKRGLENDYIMDYNRGEITFTSNLLITKDTRLIVEYEFADQNYLRSLYTINSQLKSKKWAFNIHIYNEQDSKSSTGIIELDSIDLRVLEAAGDDLNAAVRSGLSIADATFTDQIIYQRVFEPSISDSILVFDPTRNPNGFLAQFTDLGNGNGSYAIDQDRALNGRVYQYVGQGNGNYEAVIRLTPPEKRQISSFGSKFNYNKNGNFSLELAMSNNDLNRFSSIDNGDNVGTGIYFNWEDQIRIDSAKNSFIKTFFNSEIKSNSFRALNPYRAQEFSRDWTYMPKNNTSETLSSAGIIWQQDQLNSLSYILKHFNASSQYEGYKNIIKWNFRKNTLSIDGVADLLNAETASEDILFFKPNIEVRKSFISEKLLLGFRFEKEENQIRNLQNNIISPLSFDFRIYKYFVEFKGSENYQMGAYYIKRHDLAVRNNIKDQATDVDEYGFYGNHSIKSKSRLDWNISFRDLKISNSEFTNEIPNATLLARVNHQLFLFNRGLTLNTVLENNTGQEPKLEEQFVEVQMGEGSYIWVDNAPMDSIQQINEFILTPFADQGNYEKISLFNNEFIQINKTILNQSLRIEPARWISSKNDQKSLLRKLSWMSRYRIDQKIEDNNAEGLQLNFTNFNFQDSTIIAYNGSSDHSLFINRGNSKFDGAFGRRQLRSKLLLITGFDQRLIIENYSRWRFSFKSKSDLIFEGGFGTEAYDSEINNINDYELDVWNIKPSLSYRPSASFRITGSYTVEHKNNTLEGRNESSHAQDLGFELNWRKASSTALIASFNFVNIQYTGPENTQIELEMLDGLKPGNNYVWNLNYTKRLSNTIDMIISYNGRKTGIGRTVHVFSTQIKANF